VNGMDRYYQVLGLNPGASEEEIKETYRKMIKVWDVDHFPNDPKMQKMVNERLKEIDEAYKNLLLFLSGHYNKGETEPLELQSKEGNKRGESLADFAVQMEIQESTAQKKQISRQKVPYDPSYPPDWVDPDEPLFESEKDRSAKTGYGDHGGSQPPPKQPFGQPPPHINPIRQEKQTISYFPLMIFFLTIGGAIGKSITNFVHLSLDNAFLYGGGIPALLGGIGGVIAVGIVKIINGMEKPRKHKVRLAWGVAVIGGLLFPLIFWFIFSPFLEHKQPRTSSSVGASSTTPSEDSTSKEDPLLTYLRKKERAEVNVVPEDVIWKLIVKDSKGSAFFYDTKYIVRQEDKVGVWSKTVYGDKAIRPKIDQTDKGHDRVTSTLEVNQIDCGSGMARRLRVLHYSIEGLCLGYSDTPSEWIRIPPNTVLEILQKEVCR